MQSTVVNSDFIHVVAGLIRHPEDPNKIFLSRRQAGQHLENLWEFPGGKLEPGESRFHALKRELEEENGIQVVSALPFRSVKHRYDDKRVYLDVWEVKHYRGAPHGREGQETTWQSIDNLFELDFPDADVLMLKALDLPSHLLFIPQYDMDKLDPLLEQFRSTLERCHYPLIVFHAPHFSDKAYADAATQLSSAAQDLDLKVEVVISRPNLKAMHAKSLQEFKYRRLDNGLLPQIDKRRLSEELRYSAACHSQSDLRKAQALGCSFATLSIIRNTLASAGRQAKGWNDLRSMIGSLDIPVYALGGVRRVDLALARYQGAVGVAGSADFWIV
jgi:8-oxo-dGTP diphosphatase